MQQAHAESAGNWSKLLCLFSASLPFASSRICAAGQCGDGEFSGSFDANEIVEFMRFKVPALILYFLRCRMSNIGSDHSRHTCLGLDGFGIRNERSHIAAVAMKNSFRFFPHFGAIAINLATEIKLHLRSFAWRVRPIEPNRMHEFNSAIIYRTQNTRTPRASMTIHDVPSRIYVLRRA